MLTPRFRFTFTLVKYPASAGTVVYRWSERPLADAGAWSEGRLTVIGDVDRSCTDQDGNYRASELTIEGSDDDGLIRNLIAVPITSTVTSREGHLELLSETGYLASSAWRSIFRGRVQDIQATPGRRWQMKLTDVLGSEFSGFNLEKLIPIQRLAEADFPQIPEKQAGLPFPLIVGEHTDVGVKDAAGNAADKGLLPVIYAGDGNTDGTTTPPVYLPAPSGLGASIVGTPGTSAWRFGVSTISTWGESTLSILSVTTAPDSIDGSNYVSLSWTAVPQAKAYRVWAVQGTTAFPASWVGLLTNSDTYTNPETTFHYVGQSATLGNPPLVNYALASDNRFGILIAGLGNLDIHEVYASNLAEGTAPKRVRLGSDTEGVEWYTAVETTASGITYTAIRMRGPRLKAHIEGTVTVTWNGCGMKNAAGVMVDQAFFAGELFINEHILKNKGAGSRGELPTTLETFANGDAQLKTSAWLDAQQLTIDRIGGFGYMAAWAIYDPITVREFLRWFCVTFDCRIAANHHGQIYPVVINDLVTAHTGRFYRDREEDVELLDQHLAHDEVENRIVYDFDWDDDTKAYRIQGKTVEDKDSIAAHSPGAISGDTDQRGVRQKSTYGLRCTRDPATAADAMARRLTRNKYAPRYVTHRQNLMGLEDDLGARTRFTHYDGINDIGTQMLVLGHKTLPDADQLATELTVFDVTRLVSFATQLLTNGTDGIVLQNDATAQELR